MIDEETAKASEETARSFVEAVLWGDHEAVWDLLADEGRKTVLQVAVKRGMDEELAARLGDGTAAASERNEFLLELVHGLRADLEGHDLDSLQYELDQEGPDPGEPRVSLIAPVPAELGPGLPVGSIHLSDDGERWRVERLVPVRSQSA